MIYLDHHATTPVLPEVWEAMRPYQTEVFGNPSSAHSAGRKARQALEDARECCARLLGAFPDEVIFTSGATESNNLALFGMAGAVPGHLLASPTEHPCVLEPLRQLALRGFDVEWLPVESNGSVRAGVIAERIRPETRLLALMLVNHETGAFQSVSSSLPPHVNWHCDAAQAVGKFRVLFHELRATSLSASGHKFGAPKGTGLLLLKRSVQLQPLFHGGHQQHGRRPGTESVASAVGLSKALEVAHARMSEALALVRRIRQNFLVRLAKETAPIVVNSAEDASPYVVNVSFPGCRAELLLMKLDLLGVACSTGSACSSGSLLPSPVLQAMNVSDDVLRSALRFSFSSALTDHEVAEAAGRIIKCVNELRQAREA